MDFDYTYTIYDDLGWFNEEGIVSVNSGSSFLLETNPIIFDSELVNNIVIEICPISKYDVECKSIEIFGLSCTTNSNNSLNECLELIYGDVNYDGIVNVLDILVVIQMILGEQQIQYSADLNQDNIVNIIDALLIVNIILD